LPVTADIMLPVTADIMLPVTADIMLPVTADIMSLVISLSVAAAVRFVLQTCNVIRLGRRKSD